jgi:intracellular sulfur oxidation DsrE/DsrF family protein
MFLFSLHIYNRPTMTDAPKPVDARRSFLSRLAAVAAAVGAASSRARAAGQNDVPFRAGRHAEDDWLDGLPGRHRIVFDAITATGADEVRQFASNFFVANRTGYGLTPTDLAIVIILRHWATPFAFNDPMWAKYGPALAKIIGFSDPTTHEAPRSNVYLRSGFALTGLIAQGVHFAVCGVATRFLAGGIADAAGGSSAAIYDELAANMIPNSHLVAAGVVAVNRAQERGYTYAYVG